MPDLKLYYFDAAGRAECIRVTLSICGLPFEDKRLSFPEFGAMKASGAFPIGSVPVLEVDGVSYPQTAAMLRFAARLAKSDLYPADATQGLVVDSVLDSFNDTLSSALMPSLFERDLEKKLAMRAEFVAGPMARVFGFTERVLASSGGPFVLGATMSIADIVVALQVLQIKSGGLDGVGPELLNAYPHLSALTDAYLAEPRVAAYVAAKSR